MYCLCIFGLFTPIVTLVLCYIFTRYIYRDSKLRRIRKTISSSGKSADEATNQMLKLLNERNCIIWILGRFCDIYKEKENLKSLIECAKSVGCEVVIKQRDTPDEVTVEGDSIHMDIDHSWKIENGVATELSKQ